jgi:hypothetical protein
LTSLQEQPTTTTMMRIHLQMSFLSPLMSLLQLLRLLLLRLQLDLQILLLLLQDQ